MLRIQRAERLTARWHRRPIDPRAERNARLKHKQLGVPLVVWRDGKVVEIPPAEIVIDPPDEALNSDSPDS